MKSSQHSQQSEPFAAWFHFLFSVRNDPKNLDHLLNYFFDRFAQSPEQFYHFILAFQEKIAEEKGDSQHILAEHYLKVLSLVCDRAGFFVEKRELDDFCFQIVLPDEYARLTKILFDYQKKSRHVIDRILKTFSDLLEKNNFDCEVYGRYKNLYSIYLKTQKFKHSQPLRLNDLFAFRIIVKNNSVEDCFKILNFLHDEFYPLADFFKDYISIPKINGYQSIHTGLSRVLPDLDLPIELQIRTSTMHDFAEHGVASHWLYAKKKKSVLPSPAVLSQTPGEKPLYFLSYMGDIFRMDRGSTALDFAYFLHTDLGHRVKDIEVNGRKMRLDYVIQDGDMLRIIPETAAQVAPEWVSMVQSKETKKKIKDFLKKNSKHSSQCP